MEEFSIEIGAKVDEFVKGVKDASDEAKKLSSNLDKTAKESKKTTKSFDEVEEASRAFKLSGKQVSALNGAFGGLGNEVKNILPIIGAVGQSFGTFAAGLANAFKVGVAGARALTVAIAATGIGLIVIALGAIVAYWDDIVSLVTGVSQETAVQLDNLRKQSKLQQESVNLLNASDNILKLQGKSQTQINNLKIKELQVLLEIQKQELSNLKTQLAGVKQRDKAIQDFVNVWINSLGIIAIESAKVFDNLFGTNFAQKIGQQIDFARKKVLDLFTPGAANDLKKEIEDLTLTIRKNENAVAGFILQNQAIAAKAVQRIKGLSSVVSGELKAIGNTPIATAGIDKFTAKLTTISPLVNLQALKILAALEFLNAGLDNILQNGIANTLAGVGEAIGNSLASGASALEATGAALLSGIGGILVDLGKLAIQTGIGILAVKTALKSLNPAVAIAAGVALVALGSAFKKGASSLASGGGGSSFSGASGGSNGSGSQGTFNTSFSPAATGQSRVVFEIAGTRLLGVLNNTLGNDNRIGGDAILG